MKKTKKLIIFVVLFIVLIAILLCVALFVKDRLMVNKKIKQEFNEYKQDFDLIGNYVYKDFSLNKSGDERLFYDIQCNDETDENYLIVKDMISDKERQINLDSEIQQSIKNIRIGYKKTVEKNGPGKIAVNEYEIVFFSNEQAEQIIFSLNGEKDLGIIGIDKKEYYKDVSMLDLGDGWYTYRSKSSR